MKIDRSRSPWRLALGWANVARTLLVELLKATWATLRLVYAPRGSAHPAILAVPLDVTSPAGITLFANMITLTPGTTTLDVSADQRVLYVHALDAPQPEQAAQDMKTSLEASVKRVLP